MQTPDLSTKSFQALGESEAFINLQERISLAAKTDRPVILMGERGTGKELAARRLHLLSGRWNQAYVTLNCGSLAPSLIESELFGHEAGSFTGAIRQRKGRFEMADDGSLFLDEVANIPMTAQEKILRVVEYGQMERVGGSQTLETDVRLIAAANVDLRELAQQGRFRQDLLDRLSFEVITLPPLRSRGGDILLLAAHFARRMAGELGQDSIPAFSKRAERQMLEYAWPGNVRELKNAVERMVYRSRGAVIDELVFDPFDSPYALAGPAAAARVEADDEDKDERWQTGSPHHNISSVDGKRDAPLEDLPLPEAVRALEIRRIQQALESCRHNQRKAAEHLGLSYHQFRSYYRKYRRELVGGEG